MIFNRIGWGRIQKEFAAKEKLEIVASFQEAKTAKEPVKNTGSNHILGKENFVEITKYRKL